MNLSLKPTTMKKLHRQNLADTKHPWKLLKKSDVEKIQMTSSVILQFIVIHFVVDNAETFYLRTSKRFAKETCSRKWFHSRRATNTSQTSSRYWDWETPAFLDKIQSILKFFASLWFFKTKQNKKKCTFLQFLAMIILQCLKQNVFNKTPTLKIHLTNRTEKKEDYKKKKLKSLKAF